MRIILITHWCCSHCWVVVTPTALQFLTPPVRKLGVNNRLGRDTAGTADTNWPKAYSILHGIMLNQTTGERQWPAAWRLGGHQSEGGEQLYSHILYMRYIWVLLYILFQLLLFYLLFQFSYTVLISTQEFCLLSSSLPHATDVGGKWMNNCGV